MEAELLEIYNNFLAKYPPFNELPEETLTKVTENIEISYYRQDTPVIHFGDQIHDLYMVRSGVVEVYRRKGELYNRLDEGDLFGQMGLLTNNKVRFPVKAIEDSLLYCIPQDIFQELYDNFDSFADFVEVENSARLRQAVSENNDANDLTTSKVKTLLTRDAPTIERGQTIQEAAQLDGARQCFFIADCGPRLYAGRRRPTISGARYHYRP